MRYFLSLALTEAALTFGVGMTPVPGCAVAARGATLRLTAGYLGAAVEAVDVPVIAVLAKQYLAVTPGAVVHPGG